MSVKNEIFDFLTNNGPHSDKSLSEHFQKPAPMVRRARNELVKAGHVVPGARSASTQMWRVRRPSDPPMPTPPDATLRGSHALTVVGMASDGSIESKDTWGDPPKKIKAKRVVEEPVDPAVEARVAAVREDVLATDFTFSGQ